jgi:hypothetical protein
MGFEGLFKKKSRTEEEKAADAARAKQVGMLGVAAAGAVGAGAMGHAIHESDKALEERRAMNRAPASAPASAENPTLGKSSADAPPPITIPSPENKRIAVDLEAPEGVVIDLAEKHYVINPTFDRVAIDPTGTEKVNIDPRGSERVGIDPTNGDRVSLDLKGTEKIRIDPVN